MSKEFHQVVWDSRLEDDWRAILELAVREDLGTQGDRTTEALVPEDVPASAGIVARQGGVVAGLPGVAIAVAAFDARLQWTPRVADGQEVISGQCVGTVAGPARGLLAAERTALNFLGRLSGIATLTREYVNAVPGGKARVYDTRKTTPGWRRLEKYAVRCGGGWNHRGGLDEAVLIKDNHLAFGVPAAGRADSFSAPEAIARARSFLHDRAIDSEMIIEVEVDTLEQFDAVLPTRPDIILLDNMRPAEMREAVIRRNKFDRSIQLEASGGVSLDNVRAIAQSGVDRISIGALTHSAAALDFGLDWDR